MAYRPSEVMFGFGEPNHGVQVALLVQRRPLEPAIGIIEIDNIDLDCALCLKNGFLSRGPNIWTLIEDMTQELATVVPGNSDRHKAVLKTGHNTPFGVIQKPEIIEEKQ